LKTTCPHALVAPSGEQGHPGSFPVQPTEDASGVTVFAVPSDEGLSPLLVHPAAVQPTAQARPAAMNVNVRFAHREANGDLTPATRPARRKKIMLRRIWLRRQRITP
jgi:hypothetical protein